MTDVHDYGKKLETSLARLRSSPYVNDADKEKVERFSVVLRTQRLSLGRVEKYVNHLTVMAATLSILSTGIKSKADLEKLGATDPDSYSKALSAIKSSRGYEKATKDDMDRLAIWIYEDSHYSANTKHDCVVVLKRFYQWLRAPEDKYREWRRKHVYPTEVEDMESTIKLNERFNPSDMLKQEETNALIEASDWAMVKGAVRPFLVSICAGMTNPKRSGWIGFERMDIKPVC